jgi:RNA polymerase sigma factor (sigma-70 family)
MPDVDWELLQAIARKRARYYRGDREELASVGLLAIAEKLSQFNPSKGSFHKWATYTADRAIAHACEEGGIIRVPRRSRDAMRKAGREHELPVQDTEAVLATHVAQDDVQVTEASEALLQALAWLRRVERRVLELSLGLHGKALEAAAIARQLAPSPGAKQGSLALGVDRESEVRGIKARALAKLQQFLGD